MTNREPPARFPYVWTEESDVPRFLRVRAEGLPLREAIWSGLRYLQKYRRAKWSAPIEELHYFDEQRQLLHHLASNPIPVDATNACPPVRLALVGDIMWLRRGWDTFLSSEVLAYLNGHDVVLGNLESPISSRFKVPSMLPDYFTFNSDPRLLTSFHRPSGEANTFTALSTANNHTLDRGDDGLTDTLALLDSLGIPHSGVRARVDDRPWVCFESRGIRIGFYAACWGMNDPQALRSSRYHIEVVEGLVPRVRLPVPIDRIRSVLAEMASEGVEYRIVSLHWGHEFEFYPLPEQMQVGREIIRAGADLLMGSHPHVVQPLEVCLVNGYERRYHDAGLNVPATTVEGGCLLNDETGVPRKGLIVYSLGNFATAMYTLHCRTGLILGLHLSREQTTGRIDWHHPETQLVFNVHRDAFTHRRRLMLLESYLRQRERLGDHADKLRALASYLERHLLGTDVPNEPRRNAPRTNEPRTQ